MVSFMAVETFTAYPLWYTVSSLVVFAARPPMTASAEYAGAAPGIQSLGVACHLGVDACRRGIKTALWRASQARRPEIPLRLGARSLQARSPMAQ